MVSWFSSWAQGIVIAVIIATILEMILPEGNNKKYVKMIIGVYILYVVVSPVITKFTNKEISLDTSVYEKYFDSEKYSVSSNIVEQNNEDNIKSMYISSIKSDIISRLKLKGYHVNINNIETDTNSQDNYGDIKKINLSVYKIEKENTEEKVDNVQIVNEIKIDNSSQNANLNSTNTYNDTGNKNQNNTSIKITEGDKSKIKEYLNSTYGIAKNNININ